ncbi:MAG: NADH-quinone oxidoreductase subunit N [Bacteroidota bacterium]
MVQEIFSLMKPELLLVLLLFILLFWKLAENEGTTATQLAVINILLIINFVAGLFLNSEGSVFSEVYKASTLATAEKNILNFGVCLISMQSYGWLKTHKHVLEFYMLLVSTLIGFFLMISGQNLLVFYLGLELATIPLAALCNFDLEKRKSSEAAMKLIMSSAFSSALLLFGISLVYGTTGTINFTELSLALSGSPLQLFAFVLLIAGFAFKISAVPFHLWTADVYEGSPVAVTSYLSVISKGAIIFVFASVLYTVFKPLASTWYNLLFLISVLTMIIGNLFAIRQNNMKRFLAFSSIAQVGFILIGISGSSDMGTASVVFFVLVYVFSNLGAFGVVSAVSSITGKENMSDYSGFYKTNPLLSWVLVLSLFSLAGIPPTAGFFGKFFLLMAGAGKGNYVLIVIAALNMIVSLFYYLKVVRTIFMEKNEAPMEKLAIDSWPKFAMAICVTGIITLGFVSWVYEYISGISIGM